MSAARLVFLATLAVYVAGLAPEMYWLDSSELAAAAWQLGVAHPPGHPLAALLGKACTLLPFGSIALRVGLASALCAAGAAAQTALLAELVSRRLRDRDAADGFNRLLGGTAGLLFGLSYAAAFQAVRPEVYALSALLLSSTALELARWDATGDRRRLYLAGLWAGLAVTNHHLVALSFLLPAALFAALRRARPGATAALARILTTGALGFAVLAYLPLRASRHPLVDWGAPSTWPRFFWMVSAKAFQKSVARGNVGDAFNVGMALLGELSPLGGVLALGGAYVLLRVSRTRSLGALCVAATLLDAATPALVGFDRTNPDAYGYLEMAVALPAVMLCALPAALAAQASTAAGLRNARIGAALLLVAALGFGATSWTRVARPHARDATSVLGGFLDASPSRALIVTSDFQSIFGLYYLRSCEGQRADVNLLHRHFLAYPGYRDEVLRSQPELGPLVGAREVEVPALLAYPALRVEYDLDLDPRLWPASETVAARGALPIDAAEPQTRRYLAWQAFLATHRACKLHDRAAFEIALKAARAIIGQAPELDQLDADCH